MKKRKEQKLNLDRETLRRLDGGLRSVEAGTLTYEGGCDSDLCPKTGTDPGCTASTVSCSQ